MLYQKGTPTSPYTLRPKQDELLAQLGISRQALNVHLRKLKNRGYTRAGRGLIAATDKGLNALDVSTTLAFILVKVSPIKRIRVYDKIKKSVVSKVFIIACEVEALLIVERENLDEILKNCALQTESTIQDLT